jgi:predicted DNA repair protein MutK
MSVGLLALLDDVAALAKVAAASLDDIAGQAMKAGAKAAGAVIDDAAVTPRYVHGFTADRELPIVGQIALGSIRNKLLILLPAALVLSIFLPWLINPLLMLGGAYLCYEGAEKVFALLFPHQAHGHEAVVDPVASNAAILEKEKVAGAIKTDFILSAEIMTIALAAIPAGDIINQALVLLVVAVGITAMVYGGVALIVKADDIGLHMATNAYTGAGRSFGRGLVKAMPVFMKVLSAVGTAAMVWVGGGIILHGLAGLGVAGPEHWVHDIAHATGTVIPALEGFLSWLTTAALSGILGLILGFILIPVAEHAVAPVLNLFRKEKATH